MTYFTNIFLSFLTVPPVLLFLLSNDSMEIESVDIYPVQSLGISTDVHSSGMWFFARQDAATTSFFVD